MFRAIDKWLPGYLRSIWHRPRDVAGPRHLLFCVADHFEPFGWVTRDGGGGPAGVSREDRMALVETWAGQYPRSVEGVSDADGHPPRHTFFCSPDDYDETWMNRLVALCRMGHAEVELHIHHRNDTAASLKEKLTSFRDLLRDRHGLLGSWRRTGVGFQVSGVRRRTNGEEVSVAVPSSLDVHSDIAYGFVHGNWALCNARPDGDWCGVNEELSVLNETGCYADFTYPSAPSPTQPIMVNSIYRAWDRPEGRGQESGVAVATPEVRSHRSVVSSQAAEEEDSAPRPSLMLIQGPLALDWRRRKWGFFPRIDNGGITHFNPPAPGRVDLWAKQHIHIGGRPEWVFVKTYCHGMIPSTSRVFLGGAMRRAHEHLQRRYNDGQGWSLHYVTAREMHNIARAAEDGLSGNPGEYRDYAIAPPAF